MLNNKTSSGDSLAKWGLQTGQVRTRRVARNCEWYDKYGNRLGFGDLNTIDLKRIAAGLGPNDIFLAIENPAACLPEGDSIRERPAVETLVKHSSYAITQGRVCRVIDKPGGVTVLDGRLMLWPIAREVLRRRLLVDWQGPFVVNN